MKRLRPFAQLLLAEWTKFRTVKGWLITTFAAALVTVLLGLTTSVGLHGPCGDSAAADCGPRQVVGPDGTRVTDEFSFAHRGLSGDGSITVRITSFIGVLPRLDGGPPDGAGSHPGLPPWAKAGVIIKQSSAAGSSYAAVMITGAHGVRMQYDYTHDAAGGNARAREATWLRLTRTGGAVTGEYSSDGVTWMVIGTVHPASMAGTVQLGLFVASPYYELTDQSFGGSNSKGGPSEATATVDLTASTGSATGDWQSSKLGSGAGLTPAGASIIQRGNNFTITGAGDIAPVVAGPGGNTIERGLVGSFAGLLLIVVIATMFVTTEYRRGLIWTSLLATPRRERLLAAKVVVLGVVGFVTGLVAALITVVLVAAIQRSNGVSGVAVSGLTQARVLVGTGALFAVAAVLAMTVGVVFRRSTAAVAVVVVMVVLPYLLAVASVVPAATGQWLLRVTPAAAFAVQQSTSEYAQVASAYLPSTGYFPLSPLGGFGVLCGWTALALGVALLLLRRRDV